MTTSTPIDLTPYLESIGLDVRRTNGDEAVCMCPAHLERLGRRDTNPSFSFNMAKLVGKCRSCDWKVPSLEFLTQYMTGRPADASIISEAKAIALEDDLRQISKAKRAVTDQRRVLQWKFRQLRPVPAKLLELRRLTAEVAEYFTLRFDPEAHAWAIPIHTPRAVLMGWQLRQKGAVFNYPKGMVKSETLFGLHLIEGHRVALVESPLDAVRLHQAGVPAVASFGAEVSNKQIELLSRNCSEVIVALDNDEPGKKAAERVLFQLKKRVGAVPWRYEGRIKDPGEYRTDEEIQAAWRRTLLYGL